MEKNENSVDVDGGHGEHFFASYVSTSSPLSKLSLMDSHRRPTNSSQFFYTDRLSDGYFLFRYLHALVAWQAGSRPFSLQRQTANDITTILTLVLMSLLHVTR